jgi:hypothetical protein
MQTVYCDKLTATMEKPRGTVKALRGFILD